MKHQDFAEHVRHYGITFTGPSYSVWILTPKEYDLGNPSWKGCSMQLIEKGDCTGVHAKSNATSEIFILVTELMASTILASHIWFICCSFGLHIWFIIGNSEVALLLAWTPVSCGKLGMQRIEL